MGFKLVHQPSSTSIELSKEPDLPLQIGISEQQDVVKTDAGVRKIFTRMIAEDEFTLSLKLLNHRDRKLLTQFWKETVFGQQEKFDIEIQIDHQEPLQVGSLQDGQPILVGTVLDPDCGEPAGPIQVGQWVRQDRYLFPGCRFNQRALVFIDSLPFNFDVQLRIVQEKP